MNHPLVSREEVSWGAEPVERADAARNRRVLLATAREMLAEEGADKLTMDGLAERAGLGKGTVFFDATKWAGTKGKTHDGKPALQLPDGMKVDQKGNLWATGPGGLLIFTAEGKHLGTLVTGVNTGNCCFGEDGSTLFVMCDKAIGRIKTKTKGIGF